MQALEDLRQKMHQFVVQELGPLLYDQRLSEAEIRKQVEEQLQRAMAQERLAFGSAERQALVQSVFDDILGYGPIDRLLRDPSVSEIMVNGPGQVFIEREGKIVLTDVRFVDDCTCGASSTRSSARSAAASTRRPRWSTPGCPTAPG